ncbi:hypothetical protein AVEN_209101-1 [Araneus ventricosus]|uniref:Uncharacterized protein n=1 Tax=Araneus ventricosus TaxID=182803 RepID=A0A4Y2MHX8_ARAVE|nr:hypothetical protein AVEN_209101-1 [Araneus ventricosus]
MKIANLICFLADNEDLIKQQPDATSSSDSAPDFSPSSGPQTDGPLPSRGPIPRTLISPPTSFEKQRNFGACLKIVSASRVFLFTCK